MLLRIPAGEVTVVAVLTVLAADNAVLSVTGVAAANGGLAVTAALLTVVEL